MEYSRIFCGKDLKIYGIKRVVTRYSPHAIGARVSGSVRPLEREGKVVEALSL